MQRPTPPEALAKARRRRRTATQRSWAGRDRNRLGATVRGGRRYGEARPKGRRRGGHVLSRAEHEQRVNAARSVRRRLSSAAGAPARRTGGRPSARTLGGVALAAVLLQRASQPKHHDRRDKRPR